MPARRDEAVTASSARRAATIFGACLARSRGATVRRTCTGVQPGRIARPRPSLREAAAQRRVGEAGSEERQWPHPAKLLREDGIGEPQPKMLGGGAEGEGREVPPIPIGRAQADDVLYGA